MSNLDFLLIKAYINTPFFLSGIWSQKRLMTAEDAWSRGRILELLVSNCSYFWCRELGGQFSGSCDQTVMQQNRTEGPRSSAVRPTLLIIPVVTKVIGSNLNLLVSGGFSKHGGRRSLPEIELKILPITIVT